GYYDAGDNIKFGWPMSFSVALLSWAATEYKAQISAAGQLDYLHSAIRWGADFILKAHTSPTTLYTQVGDGSDHSCWERPEDMDTPRNLFKITESSPGTEVAADAAAALASAYMVFESVDPDYATKLLEEAKALFEFADKYRGSYQASCPFYCSFSSYEDELLWGATWLFKATKDVQFLTYVSNNQKWSDVVPEFSWDNKFVGAQALLAKEYLAGKKDLAIYKTHADAFVCSLMPGSGAVRIQTTPGGLLFTRDTVNLQYVTSAVMVLFYYSNTLDSAGIGEVQCSSANFTNAQIRAFAKSQVDYILGNNPLGYSYMVGFGTKYPKRIHHRGASIPSIKYHPAKVACGEGFADYFNTDNPNANIHVGAIVGGPNSGDAFGDVRSESIHSEPTTYMNAAFLGALAPLLDEKCRLQLPLDDGASMASTS
uniref:Endoglucanase n=2 Tax=Elaeis guineensis var. tenera TaxID=51953 RepID=A0A6I9QMZ9_ELAGV